MDATVRRDKTRDDGKDRPAEVTAGIQARILAATALKYVLHDKQPFDETFAIASAKAPFASLAGRDRAFARAISVVSLRHLGQIEDLLSRFVTRPLPAEAIQAKYILVAAVAQLVFLDVAPHAAISLAVDQAKAMRGAGRFANLINAVLRRVAREAGDLVREQDVARLNTPAWLFERWTRFYGEATAAQIANAHLEEPPLDLSLKSSPKIWEERLSGTLLQWNSLRLSHKGRIEEISGYDEGEWWVQDAAAALPALLLGDVKGLHIADLCASPGGKTAQLASRGAHVTAIDISPKRLRRLKENMSRLNLDVDVVQADAGEWTPAALFDAVLLDAPCSATGTIRRNPDILYLKSEADIAALSKVQQRLFNHAVELVKPGGKVIYCSCSLEPEEGEEQVERLIASRNDVSIDMIDAKELDLPQELISSRGMLRTLPFYLQLGATLNGMDGFFATRILKSP